MVYITSSGAVTEKRSLFRATILSDIFWSILNAVGLLLTTIFVPVDAKTRKPKADTTSGRAPAFKRPPKGPSNVKGLDSLKKQGCAKAAGG